MIEDKLTDFKNKIDPLLKEYFNKEIQKHKKIFIASTLLFQQIKDLTLRGGDRIRPLLFNYGFRLIKTPNNLEEKELLRLSIAFEMFHSFALIHDDIIDNCLIRRGGKTVNSYFQDHFGSFWGDRLAILSGDMAEIFCQELFRSRLFQNKLNRASSIFVQMKKETIIGEYLDTILPLASEMPNEENIKLLLCYKSGNYSIQKPLLIGAILAGANREQHEILAQIGTNLGLAFQLRDDVLGIFGKQKSIGKSVTSDIIEGKRTLLMIKTWKNLHSQKDKNRLIGLLGNKNVSEKDVLWIKKIIVKTGALDYCQKECKKLALAAKSLLESRLFKQEARLFLAELADFIISRNY